MGIIKEDYTKDMLEENTVLTVIISFTAKKEHTMEESHLENAQKR